MELWSASTGVFGLTFVVISSPLGGGLPPAGLRQERTGGSMAPSKGDAWAEVSRSYLGW